MANYLAAGTALQQERYVVGPTLGEGGFGITYRGEDTRLNRKVAIKELFVPGGVREGGSVIPATSYSGESWRKAIQSFLQEARILAGLDYPGIVGVYDYFEQNNTAYMVMKFIEGPTLAHYVFERGGTLAEDEALTYTMQVGRALEVVHAHSLLHRDIKPSNIILTPSGAVLVDFGAAREFAIDRSLIQTAVISAGFSPPEQFYVLGRKGPYSDVFSLAATCYYMIAGVTPGGEAKQQPSPHVYAALNHALAYNAADRPQTVAGFLAELSGSQPIPAYTVQVLAGAPRLNETDPGTRLGLPSFVATYPAAAPLTPALPLGGGGMAAAVMTAAPPAPTTSQLLSSAAPTRVVSRPQRVTGANPTTSSRLISNQQLIPVAARSNRHPLLWLVAPLLIVAVAIAALVFGLMTGSDKSASIGGMASPTATMQAASPTPLPSATRPGASPTVLAAPVLSATNTPVPTPTSAPTAPPPIPRHSPTAAPPLPTHKPHRSFAQPTTTPRPQPTSVPPTATVGGQLIPPSATPLPPTLQPGQPSSTPLPATPTQISIAHRTHVPSTATPTNVPATATPLPSPTGTPNIFPPLPTATPSLVLPSPIATKEPPPSDTPLPKASNTPVPLPSNTPEPPPTDTPGPGGQASL